VADLFEKFEADHLPTLRPSTRDEYRGLIREIVTELGTVKVATCAFEDISRLHRKLTSRGTPYRANRMIAVLSKAFRLAALWKWREAASPTIGIEKNPERARAVFDAGRTGTVEQGAGRIFKSVRR
jgi:hypothetical protein